MLVSSTDLLEFKLKLLLIFSEISVAFTNKMIPVMISINAK